MKRFLSSALLGLAAMGLAGCGSAISDAKDAVRAELRDPDSAIFQNVRSCGGGDAVMGEVNAKNGYGGYTGFKRFYYAAGTAEIDDARGAPAEQCMREMEAMTQHILNRLPAAGGRPSA